jgi:nucleoid-associated protein YejK
MKTMLTICEDFAEENNLEFSTDPVPAKSKCIYMQGNMKQPNPVNLKLYGVELPWVKTDTHLGHELSEDYNLEQDMKCKRGGVH